MNNLVFFPISEFLGDTEHKWTKRSLQQECDCSKHSYGVPEVNRDVVISSYGNTYAVEGNSSMLPFAGFFILHTLRSGCNG